jgi:Rrf2 family protein
MNLNRSVWYAFCAASSIAQQEEAGPVMAKSIAEQFAIPLPYLLKVLQQLVRANILRSIRGPRGGFYLSRPARGITLLQIFEAIEGPLNSFSETTTEANSELVERISNVYQGAAAEAAKVFSKVSLDDLIRQG